MATRRRRRWLAIGGATAAVAVGAWAVALAAPTGFTGTSPTRQAPHLTWADADATSSDLERATGGCSAGAVFGLVQAGVSSPFDDSTAPANGTFCYRLTSHYALNPDASVTAQVIVDNTAPTAPVITVPASPLHGVVNISASSTDPGGSGVASVALSIDGGPALGNGSAVWDTGPGPTHVADGTYTLRAVATDNVGLQTPSTTTITIDNTPPDPPVVVTNSPVAGSPTLSWATVAGYTYTVTRDGNLVGAASPPWTDPVTPAPGAHTYIVTARDAAGNPRASAPVAVTVVATSATQPRSLAAPSPTNALPHLTWQKPTTFAVTSWQVRRDGAVVASIGDADTLSFDDAGVGTQGPHTYTVQAMSGATGGDVSSPITVIYDTVAPSVGALAGAGGADGSVSLTWPAASDPDPGSGIASYVVRRAGAAPADVSAGTAVCTVTPPGGTGCVDSAALSGTTYGYSLFAIDGAGNVARQAVSVKPTDSMPPDAVTGFHASVGPTNAHLIWDVPARQGRNADLAGFRIIRLADGVKSPTNPKDGSAVCPGLGSKDGDCFVQNLATGKKVTFAIYAADEVPNYSAPALLTLTPRGDGKKPGRATKVRLTRIGGRLTLRWVSPKDPDLSHFVVNLNRNGPAKNPGVRPIVFKGRKLTASFTLKAKQVAYVNLFSVDLSGNYSRVTRLIVMPAKLVVAKAKKKKVVKKATTPPKKTTTPPKKTGAASTTVPTKTTTPPTTVVVVTS